MRILVVEDEKKFNNILQRCLKAEGYTVDGVGTAQDGLEYTKTYHYDLVILDLQLPDGTGTTLLSQLRERGHTMPALILTAHSDLDSKIENFRAGADDYVVKPVAMAELVIRVHALLRRGPALLDNVIRVEGLELNRLTRQVRRNDRRIELTAKEYSLLEYLFLHKGRVLSRSMILEKVWDHSFEGLSNTVDVCIGQLRRKIDEGHEQKLIRTVRGAGYMLDAGPSR
jgi:two-component system copper resistance phosphate regulon response regulator CusR